MIKIKSTDHFKVLSAHKSNMFIEENIEFYHNYNSSSNIFNVILNQLIYYKKRDVYFGSIRSLVSVMNVELKKVKEHEIEDFLTIFNYVIGIFDTNRDDLGIWYHYINQDITDIEGMTLHQFHKIINSDEYKIKYIRKIKLNKLSKL